MKRRTRVYIAGPMTNGSGRNFNLAKIREAIEAHFVLIERGFVPHCPHLSIFCELMQPDRIPYVKWLELDANYIEDSDIVLRIPGDSKGADQECAVARSLSIPVIVGLGNFLSYHQETQV